MNRLPLSACGSLVALTLLAWQTTAATAQVIVGNGGGVVIFGQPDGTESARTKADPTGAQQIEFFDGRRFHGTLEALDMDRRELTWKRSDASNPLVIPLLQVTRLSFGETVPDKMMHATVQFTGGDWLTADITKIQDKQIHLQLADGSALTVNRAQVDWIYFSKNSAPECYEGPTSLSGWISGGGWSYRDGALRASMPSQLERDFTALPDQVEYRFEVDQGNLMSTFNLSLHGRGRQVAGGPGIIQLAVRADTLTVLAMMGGRFESKQSDLSDILGGALDGRIKSGKNNPVQFRVLEDCPGGRLLVFINGHKAGEWGIDKGEAGKNRGRFIFQPTIWNSSNEQSLSKIRVIPWDGREPAETDKADDPSSDRLSLADGTTKEGKFIDLALGTFRLRADNNTFEAARDQLRMLRFGGVKEAAEASPSVARIRLTQGGEFDADGIGWHDGKLQIRAHFGGEFTIPATAVTELRFAQTAPMLSLAGNVLVFKNGDRLQGRLEAVDGNEKLLWRTNNSEAVDFALTHIAGVRLGSSTKLGGRIDCVARFRNGDWLAGRFLTLDKDALVLDTQDAGQLTIARPLVRALYFSQGGSVPISDGVSDDQEWLRGLDLTGANANISNKSTKMANLWRCFDGTYSLATADNNETTFMRNNLVQIGRQMPGLPALAEISFDATGQGGQVLFTAQLFSEAGNPGYLMQFHSQGLYIYDLNPGGVRGRGGIVPQQIQFGDKLKPNANQRHIQVFANRDTGQLTVLVDGVNVAHFGVKAGSRPRQLGHGLMLNPQPGLHGSFSNIWIGPWNGRLPGNPVDASAAPDTVVLRNGDEAEGTVELATPSAVKLTSEIGPLDLAVDRLTMIDFGGLPPERSPGTRLHLAALGTLTVSSCQIENDTVTCRSEVAGDLKLPLSAMQEVVFPPSGAAKQ